MPSSASDSDPTADGRLLRAARAGAALARRLTTAVRRLAFLSAASGLGLWGLLWWPLPVQGESVLWAGAGLLVLLAPAAVLGLFYVGLRDLLALPDRLAARTTDTIDQSATAARTLSNGEAESVWGRLRRIVREIWQLRRVLLDNRALLVRYGMLLRVLTPGFLVLGAGAVLASLLLVPIAVGAGLLAWLL
jgi:hypothetical protein